ncbi:SRPBCC family protein [Membranihabitans maritimus]|uniref:SRPBCC family protein n=1 Tax=Membranihabitans maritimus TaxID=2904244 RepID=UPI001F1CE9C8|nr:hypothetical protein [Membranihabitans maritimus]
MTLVSLSACKNKEDKNSGQNNENIKMKTKETENLEETFIISHTFETDKKTLFNMWIDPETYTSWMGPTGAEMSFLNSDIKENGTALWQMTTPDQLTKYGK